MQHRRTSSGDDTDGERFEDPPVNYDEPVVPQVYAMDGKKYLQWVHRPVKGIESVRMFRSDFWERLSFTYPVAVPGLWWPVIGVGLSLMYYWYTWWWVTLWFSIGLFSWFPAEHLIHRCLFHMTPWSAWTQRAHFMFHAVHHLTPKDRFRLVMPPFVTMNVALVCVPLTVLLLDMCRAGPWWCGFGLMYTVYDLIHYSIHHSSRRVLAFLGGEHSRLGKVYQGICTNHLKHHYNDHTTNFGVTNTCTDRFMRTAGATRGNAETAATPQSDSGGDRTE